MTMLFGVCAVLGGTVMVCQFLLTLLGLGHGHDLDLSHDVGHDFGGHDTHGGDGHDGQDASHHDQQHQHHHGANWIFSVITFRTVVAALAFFGMTGLAANSADLSPGVSLPIALAVGVAAMYLVHWMMQSLYKLKSDGTARIERAVGLVGETYLRIPANRGGAGKVTLNLQNRSMEYQALTSGEAIPTGARIVVIGVAGPDTVEVEPAERAEPSVV